MFAVKPITPIPNPDELNQTLIPMDTTSSALRIMRDQEPVMLSIPITRVPLPRPGLGLYQSMVSKP